MMDELLGEGEEITRETLNAFREKMGVDAFERFCAVVFQISEDQLDSAEPSQARVLRKFKRLVSQ